MKKTAFLIFLLAAVLCLSSGVSASALGDDSGNGDRMSIKLRPRDIGNADNIRARAFLWQHWSAKKPAQLDVTNWTREGQRIEVRYEIVIGEKGDPVVMVKIKRSEDPSGPISGLAVPEGGRPRVEPPSTDSYQATIVERIRRIGNSDKVVTVPAGQSLPATKFRLRFKDQNGTIKDTF